MGKFNFKKRYGQNFLQDDGVINKIVGSIHPTEDDLVIEIGPGAGALTKRIKEYGANVICYEIDTDTKEYLDKLEDDRLHVIYDDFLNRDVVEDIANIKYQDLYLIGNLPYYITTPIILKVLNEGLNIKSSVFMVQKEVADRLSAKPKSREYGSITVFLNYFYDMSLVTIVNRNKFYPAPNVDSAVIKFVSKENIIPVDIKKFNSIVRDSFQFKRKNLRNNLSKYDKDKLNSILNELGYSLDNRAEDLPYEVFVEIANKY